MLGKVTDEIAGLSASPEIDLRTSAPRRRAIAGSAAGAPAINIEINTGVGDPIAIAREIKNLLSKYDRHIGATA